MTEKKKKNRVPNQIFSHRKVSILVTSDIANCLLYQIRKNQIFHEDKICHILSVICLVWSLSESFKLNLVFILGTVE